MSHAETIQHIETRFAPYDIAIFANVTENEYINERHPLSEAIVPLLRGNWKMARDIEVSIIH